VDVVTLFFAAAGFAVGFPKQFGQFCRKRLAAGPEVAERRAAFGLGFFSWLP